MADGQDRGEPTTSNTSVDLDLQNEDVAERRSKRIDGDLDVDDIQDPELRQKVQQAREKSSDRDRRRSAMRDEPDKDGTAPQPKPTKVDEADEGEVDRVRVEEGENPLGRVMEEASGKLEHPEDTEPKPEDYDYADETEVRDAYANGEIDDSELDAAAESALMDGVDDEDIEEAMDMDLNVVEDVDPEHFNYEQQDFSTFGGYGTDVTIEYNDCYFYLVMPGDRKQEELINSMGGASGDLTEMMNSMITHTVDRPHDIEEITADWTPFERMGLGMQCMEFLGFDSLGNM